MASKRGKIDELYDFSAMEEQHKKVMGLIEKFVETANNVKPIAVKLEGSEKTKEVIDGIKQVGAATTSMVTITNKAINEYGQLVTIFQKVSGSYENIKGIIEQYTGTLDQNMKLHAQYKIRLDEVAKAISDHKKAYAAGEVSAEQYQAKLAELTREQTELKTAGAELMQTIKSQIKENQAAATSYDAINQQLGRSRDLFRQMSEEERNSEFGKILLGNIQEMDTKLKAIDASMGNHQRKVGDYRNAFSGALKVLEDALEDVKKRMDDINKSGDASEQVVAELRKEYALLDQLVNNQVNGFASATAELKNNEKALQALSAAGLQSTQFYKDLLNSTAELKDNVGDLKAEIKNLASDTSTLDGLIQGAEALVGVWGIAQVAVNALGDDQDAYEKTLVQLQSAMVVLNSLQSIRNALQKESSLMLLLEGTRTKALNGFLILKNFILTGSVKAQQANTAATNANTTATNANAAATKAATAAAVTFRTALIATGIGAILVLLASAASAMSTFGDETEGATGNLEDFNAELEFSKSLLESYTGSLDYQNKIIIEKLKQRGASEKEINDAYIKGIENKKAANEQEIKNLEEKYNRLNRADKDYKEKAIAVLDQIDAAKLKSQDYDREITLKNEEFKTKQAEDARKKGKENADKAKQQADKELKARFELLKYQREKEIEFLKGQATNEFDNLTPFSKRQELLEEALEKEEALITAQRDFLLANDKLTGAERELIEQKANDQIIAARTEFVATLLGIRKNAIEREQQLIDESEKWTQDQVSKDVDRQIKKEESRFTSKLTQLENFANYELQVEIDRYKKGEISKEEFENRRLAIENKYRKQALEEEIKHYERLLEISDLPEDVKKDALEKLAAIRRKANQDEVNEAQWVADKIYEIRKANNDKLKDLAMQAYDVFSEAMTFQYDVERDRIQASIDKLEEKKLKEIEVANQSTLSADERERKIKEIEGKAAMEKLQLERNQRKIEAEKAKFEKVSSIFKVGIEAMLDIFKIKAQAAVLLSNPVTAPLAPMALAQIPIVAGSAGLTAGLIAARPIPKYKEGTPEEGHPGGLAITGDGGVPEYVVTPEGDISKTPAVPTLMDLPKGTKVYKDELAFMDALMAGTIQHAVSLKEGPQGPAIPWQQMEHAMDRRFSSLEKTIKNMPQPVYRAPHPVKTMVHGHGSQTKLN